ncbi:MAG: hydrogenase maturation nickel metallochaperone HypA [Clostridia bacterium]|jgi:hydrogenase nickel incorporation protein HypA/HybF|nr:hydrogenase maturation nickel metallochaperone HypA [Clostridia bacterium]
MHELGILSSMLKTLDQIMIDENLTHIEKVVLQVGEISGVIPEYIEECFPAATYKSKYEDLKLEMEVIPGIVSCKDCGKQFNGREFNLICPQCGSQNLIPVSGREFIIKEIHGY